MVVYCQSCNKKIKGRVYGCKTCGDATCKNCMANYKCKECIIEKDNAQILDYLKDKYMEDRQCA